MEFWPSLSAFKKNSSKSGKRKSKSAQAWSNYPVVDHGAQSAATLVKNGDELEWRTVHSIQEGSLIPEGSPSKVFPCTRPTEVKNVNISLRQRAKHGAVFLRTYHPDVDIPIELIEDSLKYDDGIQKQNTTFDPFAGNALSATYCFDGIKKRAVALAFPTGKLCRELNISPITFRPNSVLFQPTAQPAWTFDTPIRQIASSAPGAIMEEKSGHSLAVRTYGRVSVFDIRNQVSSMPEPTKPPFGISEIMSIRPQDLAGNPSGAIVDMNFSPSDPRKLFVVTERGVGYQCSHKDGQGIVKIFDAGLKGGDKFWRVIGDDNSYGGTVASEKAVEKFDSRVRQVPGTSFGLFEYDDGRNVLTSICPTRIEHLLCVATTSQVIWIDERYPKQPLLGWRHHRTFDRTLSLQTMEYENTSLLFLGSSKNNHVTAMSVVKPHNGPLQCQMPARALPAPLSTIQTVGRTLIRLPGIPSGSFSLLELSSQGSLHQQELRYVTKGSTISPGREYVKDRFDYLWSDDIRELERRESGLTPEYGTLAERGLTRVDLSGLYEALFGKEAQEERAKAEEASAEEVYEILEDMPTYWQRSDAGEEHMRTLFDIVFGSGEDPQREARADFSAGTVLDSARGYRARKQGRIPVAEIAEKAGWHADIQPILHKISPDVFKDKEDQEGSDTPDAGVNMIKDEEILETDRRETEAREQLALDLTLATHVFSSTRIVNPTAPLDETPEGSGGVGQRGEEEYTTFLTQETEKLSLSGPSPEKGKGRGPVEEPPHVKFGFLRPVHKITNDTKKRRAQEKGDSEEGREKRGEEPNPSSGSAETNGNTPTMPLGVRLLLSEWTVGEDPYEYEYVDPYGLDSSSAQRFPNSRAQDQPKPRRRQQTEKRAEEEEGANGQAPPAIIASRTVKEREKEVQAKAPPAIQHSAIAVRAQMQLSHERRHGMSQNDLLQSGVGSSQPQSQSQGIRAANTHVEPGRFAGTPRLVHAKKPVKKRISGF